MNNNNNIYKGFRASQRAEGCNHMRDCAERGISFAERGLCAEERGQSQEVRNGSFSVLEAPHYLTGSEL